MSDAAPAGETGTELTGDAAFEALHQALVTISKPADKTLTVRDVDFRRIGRFIVMSAKLNDGKTVIEFKVRMPRARAASIRQRLNTVLDR
jgi:hypothetical protein